MNDDYRKITLLDQRMPVTPKQAWSIILDNLTMLLCKWKGNKWPSRTKLLIFSPSRGPAKVLGTVTVTPLQNEARVQVEMHWRPDDQPLADSRPNWESFLLAFLAEDIIRDIYGQKAAYRWFYEWFNQGEQDNQDRQDGKPGNPGNPVNPGLNDEDLIDRLAMAQEALEYRQDRMPWTEIAIKIGWRKGGTPDSNIKLLMYACDHLRRLNKNDPEGTLKKVAERRKEKKRI